MSHSSPLMADQVQMAGARTMSAMAMLRQRRPFKGCKTARNFRGSSPLLLTSDLKRQILGSYADP